MTRALLSLHRVVIPMPPIAHAIAGSCHFHTLRPTGHIKRQLRPSAVSAEPSGSGNLLRDNPASRLISRLVGKEAKDSDEQPGKQSSIRVHIQKLALEAQQSAPDSEASSQGSQV